MKKQLKNGMTLLLLLCMVTNIFAGGSSEAASKNKKAGSAFARAVASGKIAFQNKNAAGIADVNGDGVKELVTLSGEYGDTLTVWKYANGKVSKVAQDYSVDLVYFNKSKKLFWLSEPSDGTYMRGCKISGKKFKEVETLSCGLYGVEGKFKAEKTVNGKTTKLSKKEFNKTYKNIIKKDTLHMKYMSKAKLIQKLAGMK